MLRFVVVLLLACGGASTTVEESTTSGGSAAETSAQFGLLNEARPIDGVITAGQPTEEHWSSLAGAGVTTVVSLRTEGEPGTEGEAAAVEAAGMSFTQIPVAGADGLTEANARALDEALANASGETLVHCGSSNRVGALFALRAFYVEGRSIDDAIELGRTAGLTRLESEVRVRLERACASLENDSRCPSN